MGVLDLFRLDGKTALVTGASRGLGQGMAIGLAEAGADIIAASKPGESHDATAEAVRAAGKQFKAYECDLQIREAVYDFLRQLNSDFPVVDILVNNAGINHPASALETLEAEWDDHFNTNIKGGFFLARMVAPMMIERKWGRVVFISSQSGLVGIPGQPVYCSTKGAIVNLVRTIGLEWAKHGITVNAIAPTFVDTPQVAMLLGDPEFKAGIVGRIPLGRVGGTSDLTGAAIFFCSDASSFVTGQILGIDGGLTATQ